MNKVISITGPSGVGKTTVSKIISICLGHQDSIIVSGDDSHLWERGDENWRFITHLNPKANDLKVEFDHLSSLKRGVSINRSHYNHSNGKFTPPEVVVPKKNIIYEGLHAMYGDLSSLADISFYIDVEPSLKNEWKISRDSRKRGYSIDQIVKTIENRKEDERKYIEPQKTKCDVILKFRKTQDDKITLSFDYSKRELTWLINKIKKLYGLLGEFVYVSGKISNNIDLCQDKGGNLSFKFEDTLVITESGSSFGKISYFEGFGFYDLNGKSIFRDQRRPSMEIDAHLKLGPCCLHTHPLHVLTILCSEECNSIFSDLGIIGDIIDYYTPGKSVAESIAPGDNVFLKNHGMFISRNSMIKALEDSLELDMICRRFLDKSSTNKQYLYPDAFVLEEENRFYQSYIQSRLASSGLSPKFLSKKDIETLSEMEEEKYRRSLK
jgi:uridine kinase/ribulose-5-phosphate 4-epimerase/fuculose-1-phosphate aldolase